MIDSATITDLLDAAISSDAVSDDGQCGFIRVMAKGRAPVRTDIAVAFEMYGLLRHFTDSLNWRRDRPESLAPGIYTQATSVVALIPVPAGELPELAFWICDGLRNEHVKRQAGVLGLAFVVERHADREHLIPEWWAVFYVGGSPEHCVPLLALRSVVDDERIGGDWVSTSLARMDAFGLPTASATAALETAVKLHNPPTSDVGATS